MEPADEGPSQKRSRRPDYVRLLARLVPRAYRLSGLVVAVLSFWISLSPSLLPRSGLYQGVISGISASIGYGVGVVGLAIVEFMLERRIVWAPRARINVLLGVAAVLGTIAALIWYANWQRELRTLMGMSDASSWQPVEIVLVTAIIFVVLIGAARLIRWCTGWLIRQITKVAPPRVAAVVGCGLVVVLCIGLVNGVLLDAYISSTSDAFRAMNQRTNSASVEPDIGELSGSPDSLVTWESLGRQGRQFVTGGPTVDQLEAFSGQPAVQPIRSYVGFGATGSIRAEAELAAAELERAGGFDRAVVCVIIGTGTGWVNEDGSDAVEYLYNGDTAIVSIQYSYLPGWMSFIVDRGPAREAGRQLFNAVYAEWSTLPHDSRPKLVVGGESLGAFGAESAFSGVDDLRIRTDGALFSGPPSFSGLWKDLVAHRDAGSPQWLPIYEDGRTVRFMARPSDLDRPDASWTTPRVVYLQYGSDPITWWDPSLVFQRPDWLEEPRGYDVLPSTRWFPIVTFLQLTADVAVARDVPNGHGHRFRCGPRLRLGRNTPASRLDRRRHRPAERSRRGHVGTAAFGLLTRLRPAVCPRSDDRPRRQWTVEWVHRRHQHRPVLAHQTPPGALDSFSVGFALSPRLVAAERAMIRHWESGTPLRVHVAHTPTSWSTPVWLSTLTIHERTPGCE